MRIVAVDRTGMVAAAVREGFRRKTVVPFEILTARDWGDVSRGVQEYSGSILVLSLRLIEGFESETGLANRVREINPNVVFYVYNGMRKSHGVTVDMAIPGTPKGGGPGLNPALFVALESFIQGNALGQKRLF